MDDSERVALEDGIATFARSANDDDPCIVTKWTLVAEMVDDKGEPWVVSVSSAGIARWDRLGLLHEALADIQSGIVVRELGEG